MKIATKISLSFLITTAIIVSTSVLLSSPTNKNNMQNAIISHLDTTAQSRADHIETLLSMEKEVAQSVALNNYVEKLLLANESDFDYEEKKLTVNTRLQKTVDLIEQIVHVSVADRSGVTITGTNLALVGSDKSSDPEFPKLLNRETVISDVKVSPENGSSVISIASPSIVNNEIIGFVFIQVNPAKSIFPILLDRTGISETGETYLVNRNGYAISPLLFVENDLLKRSIDTVNSRDCFAHAEKYGHVFEGNYVVEKHKKTRTFLDYRGEEVLGSHVYIPEMDWCLLAEIDESEALQPLNALKIISISSIIISSLSAWYLGHFIAKVITKQIDLLSKGVEIVSKGNLSHQIEIEGKNEINKVSMAFNKMTNDLKQAQNKLQDYSRGLEMKVKERTEQLEEKVTETRKAKLATLNILEDVDKAKKDLEKVNSELQRIEIKKEEFLNIAAHELKTPLQPIIGYTDRLLKTDSVNEWGKKRLNIVLENAKHLKQLVQDVLDINKMETGIMKFAMKNIDIVQVVNDSYESFKPTIEGKGLKYVFDVKEGQGSIKMRGDINRLNQVFGNLLGNAIKFTDKGSITVKLVEKANSVTISIIDTGIGIEESDAAKLFTKFFQADGSIKRNFGGTGLGLAISKEIVKAHNGKINAKSVFGKGSEFIVVLPKLA